VSLRRSRKGERSGTHLASLVEGESRPQRRPSCSFDNRARPSAQGEGEGGEGDGQQAGGVKHADDLLDDLEVLVDATHPLIERGDEGRADLLAGYGSEVGIGLYEYLEREGKVSEWEGDEDRRMWGGEREGRTCS
jgi:hypothetical protein